MTEHTPWRHACHISRRNHQMTVDEAHCIRCGQPAPWVAPVTAEHALACHHDLVEALGACLQNGLDEGEQHDDDGYIEQQLRTKAVIDQARAALAKARPAR